MITNPIIPLYQTFYQTDRKNIIQWKSVGADSIDLKAIASFCSLGFMLDDDTFSSKIKVCKPATEYQLNEKQEITKEKIKWNWYYQPEERTFNSFLEEFTEIFEKFIHDNTHDKSILLPISSGLDSRTLVVPIRKRKDITLASYEFEDGFNESETALKLSKYFDIPTYAQKIQKGYLWNKLGEIHHYNHCFTDFTHPRQVAVIQQWKRLGDAVLLGHWGDVLFNKQAKSNSIDYDEQVIQLNEKVLKPGGIELANDLWKHWGLTGSFETYITDRLDKLYSEIDIDHPSARIRAFKSLYWAPRWTSINLSIFNRVGKIVAPYYSDEMCKFICTIPEKYLKDRKIQIEYIKKHCPVVARMPWQKYYPLNLFQYHWFSNPIYYPVRAANKLKRWTKKKMDQNSNFITRNWELQFLGENNYIQLKKNLFHSNTLSAIIPQKIIEDYLGKFMIDPVKYAHPLSMILTLAVFSRRYYKE